MTCFRFTVICWCIVWGYWLISARGNKKTVYVHRSMLWVITRAGLFGGYLLLFLPLSMGLLGMRLYSPENPTRFVGVGVCIAGAAFAIWARRTIGRNWSGVITLKEDHELMRTGPYAIVRHPIYAGLLLTILGAVLALGEVRGILVFLFVLQAFWWKMREEEKLMRQQFPDAYPQYEAQVKRLIPFVY